MCKLSFKAFNNKGNFDLSVVDFKLITVLDEVVFMVSFDDDDDGDDDDGDDDDGGVGNGTGTALTNHRKSNPL